MLKQTLNQKLLQKLTPQQLQYIRLLELNSLTLDQRVEEELLENPALEEGKDDNYKEEEYDSIDSKEDFDIDDFLNDDNDGFSLSEDYQKKDYDGPQITRKEDYREILEPQILTIIHNETEEIIGKQILGTLDEDGYLRRSIQSIINDTFLAYNIVVSEELVEKVLQKIQTCDPPGVGARNLQECLSIQLNRIEKFKGSNPITKLAKNIINECIDDYGKRHYKKIIERFEVSQEYFEEASDLIGKLNPKPANSESESYSNNDYVIPDFIVTEKDGELIISLTSGNYPELRLSRSYLSTVNHLIKKQNPTEKEQQDFLYFKQKVDSAKWFIDAIKQRQNTMLAVIHSIVESQKDFFYSGDEYDLKPLMQKEIAKKINYDDSTVSRIVNSKYVQTDFGIFSLNIFFVDRIENSEGMEVSINEVYKIISDEIENEDKTKPLTDQDLKEIVEKNGYKLTRRTISKYREKLGYSTSRLRKEL